MCVLHLQIKVLCLDAVEADKNDEHGGRGEVVECLRQKVLIRPPSADYKVNQDCIKVLSFRF